MICLMTIDNAGKRITDAPVGHPLGFDDLRRGHGGRPDRTDFATVDQVRERRKRLLDVGVRVRPMDLVKIDMVGFQSAQRVFNRGHDPSPGSSLMVGLITHRPAELGREHHVVATPLERFPEDFLGLALGVRVRGVDEVDPRVQRLVDDADRVLVVGVAERPEHHRAERIGTDLDAG